MQVREWMSPDPVSVSLDASVAQARQLLEHEGIRHLPVVDDERVVGIISDRDVRIDDAALRSAVRRREVDLLLDDDRTVEAVMSAPPLVVDAEATIDEAARLMLSRRINALPVLEAGRLIGIVTSTDCLLSGLASEASP